MQGAGKGHVLAVELVQLELQRAGVLGEREEAEEFSLGLVASDPAGGGVGREQLGKGPGPGPKRSLDPT